MTMPYNTDTSRIEFLRQGWNDLMDRSVRNAEMDAARERDTQERSYIDEVVRRRGEALKTATTPDDYLNATDQATAELSRLGTQRGNAAINNLHAQARLRIAAMPKQRNPPKPIPESLGEREIGGRKGIAYGYRTPDNAEHITKFDRDKPVKAPGASGDKVGDRQRQARISKLEEKKRGLEAELNASGVDLDKLLTREVVPTQKIVEENVALFNENGAPQKDANGLQVYGAKTTDTGQPDPKALEYLNTVAQLESELGQQGIAFTPSRKTVAEKRTRGAGYTDKPASGGRGKGY